MLLEHGGKSCSTTYDLLVVQTEIFALQILKIDPVTSQISFTKS